MEGLGEAFWGGECIGPEADTGGDHLYGTAGVCKVFGAPGFY